MLNDSFALPDNMRRLRLTSDYCFGIFDCGNADLNDFLFQDAKLHSKYLHYVTYILEAGDQIIAYYSIANDKIQVSEVDDFWESMDYMERNDFYSLFKDIRSFPAIKIGRLAVDKNYQDHNIGTMIIQSLVYSAVYSNKTGCQFLILDALNNLRTVNFYERNKFDYMTVRDVNSPTRQMYRCLLMDVL